MDEIVSWKEDEDPIAAVVKVLPRGVVGIEGTTAYDTVTRLTAAAPLEARDATEIFAAPRRIKSPEEQAFIREAARRTILAIEATHRALAAGKTEGEISAVLEREFQALGVRGGGLVQFGPSAAFPHGAPGRAPARARRRRAHRRRLQGPRLQLGRHAHGRVWRSVRRGAPRLRGGGPRPEGGHRRPARRRHGRRSRPRGAQGHRGRRLGRRLHAPARPRPRHGRPRAALPRPRQRRAARRRKHP